MVLTAFELLPYLMIRPPLLGVPVVRDSITPNISSIQELSFRNYVWI